jgi:DNA-binding transcriptional LysR family regulator
MEMHQIRYFLAVSRTLNFTRAAEECNVAQPSLSRAVQKLEEELGGDLFKRERGQTHVTDLGQTMLPLLRQCYESAAAAKEQASAYGSEEYTPLKVGLSQTVKLELMTPMFTELARVYPGLQLSFVRGTAPDILSALKAGDVEVAVTANSGLEWERFDCWPLFEEGFALIVSKTHALSKRKKIKLADAVADIYVSRPYCENLDDFAKILDQRRISMTPRHEIATEADSIALIESGLGVCILPNSVDRSPSVTSIPIEDLDLTRTISAYGVFGRQRSATAASLIRLLRAADWSAIACR